MKSIIKFALLFFCSVSFSQTNLIDTSSWVEGTGPVSGFNISGASNENIRELGQNPYGTQGVLWKSQPADSTGGKRGWNTDYVNIDHTKTHRYTSWIKKTGSDDGKIYLTLSCKDDLGNYTALNLNGSVNGSPYPYSSDPQNLDQWYLLVGYIHHSGFTSTTSIGGVYDTNGEKVSNMTDFKFSNTATQLKLENILWFSTNPNHALYTYAPTIYEVNGQEPTIQELIDGPDTQAPTAPTLSSSTQTDTTTDLSWTAATDNVAVTGYNVYKDGILETTLGNVLSYQVIGLTASTAYNFTVTALDAAGNESAVSNALAITTDATSGGGTGGYWSLNNQDVYYNTGNVGIGTNITDSKLTVKGSIHSEEVKVDLSVPAPDYVFKSDYNLTPLEKLQEYIKAHGHLPNMPSANDMETHGIELGIMNMKLLEKIEELTLYMFQQQKELYLQSKKNKTLENRLIKLETLIKK